MDFFLGRFGSIDGQCILTYFTMTILQVDKYNRYEFGRCPRVYCEGQVRTVPMI
jgi:hypothetical protein